MKQKSITDQGPVDHFLVLLRTKFGDFALMENPCTRISWPADALIQRIMPILKEYEDQIELLFSGVVNYKLVFREDARGIVITSAVTRNIRIDRPRPQPQPQTDF